MKKLRNLHQLQKVLADLELMEKPNQDQELKIKLIEHHKREEKQQKKKSLRHLKNPNQL